MAILAVNSATPVAIIFTNSKGKSAQFFLKNNPWKGFSNEHLHPKAFLYCLICGSARFSAEVWSKMARDRIGSTFLCDKESCEENDNDPIHFIPYEHLMIVTEGDKSRTQGALGREFFEEVVLDKASSKTEISPELLRELEKLSIRERLSKIDAIYFEHVKKNNIQVDKLMTDTSDPFLKALAEYRQQVSNLL